MKKVLYLICFLVYCIGLEAHQMKVASYNIRFANRNDSINGNGWGQRCPVIADLIRYHDFDIFGTQEGQFHQVEELKNKLREYDYIGVGRDDGMKRGEFTAIYYKTDRFELLDEGMPIKCVCVLGESSRISRPVSFLCFLIYTPIMSE